jgi:integrase
LALSWTQAVEAYASALAAGGIRRDVVEQLMGHARKGTSSLYTHLFADALDGVEEALDAIFGINELSTDRRITTEQHQASSVA